MRPKKAIKMGRPKTSKPSGKSSRNAKSKPFDPHTFKGIELRKDVKLEDHNPEIRLRDINLVREALFEALVDGDHEGFKEILRTHLETVNKEALADRSGVARTTLFRMLAPRSNPTLKNVAKVFKFLKAG